MQNNIHGGVIVSRRTFKDLVLLWLTIVMFTFTAALLVSTARAHADIILPMPKVSRTIAPAVVQNFIVSPSPVLVDARCQKLLDPLQSGDTVLKTTGERTRRAAGNSATNAIEAIRSYRHCAGDVALESSKLLRK